MTPTVRLSLNYCKAEERARAQLGHGLPLLRSRSFTGKLAESPLCFRDLRGGLLRQAALFAVGRVTHLLRPANRRVARTSGFGNLIDNPWRTLRFRLSSREDNLFRAPSTCALTALDLPFSRRRFQVRRDIQPDR